MPNLIDIVEVAEALESKAVFLAPDRCTVVRNRHSSCRKCTDACPTDAVGAKDNVLALDNERCVACGACTTVCPTEALIPLAPLDEDLAASVADAVVASGGRAVFACARIASKRKGDPTKFAEVPCLARMEESVLLELAARGVEDILLVDGTCATCKFRACVPGIDATVASANELLAAQGSPIRVERASAFPDERAAGGRRAACWAPRAAVSSRRPRARRWMRPGRRRRLPSRRPAWRTCRRCATGCACPMRARCRSSIPCGACMCWMPWTAWDRRVAPEIDTRLFGSVHVDAEACSSCGMCAVFCPTGALKKSELVPEEGERQLPGVLGGRLRAVQPVRRRLPEGAA